MGNDSPYLEILARYWERVETAESVEEEEEAIQDMVAYQEALSDSWRNNE